MGKIGVYGGSFNPIHLGHIRAAEQMAEALELDRVLIVPAGNPPHKELPALSPTAEQRLRLTELSLLGHPGLEACDIELRRLGRSYTVDTLTQFHEQRPGDELYLMMGTDMFLCLHNWYRPDEICRLAHIVCASRANSDDPAALEAQADNLRALFSAKVHIVHNEITELSSTTVRRMLFFDCGEGYAAPEALEQMRKEQLYGLGADWTDLPFEVLKERSLALHKPSRVSHVIGCCETAEALAERWGASTELAKRAGILHDVTKALDRPEQLRLCEKYGIITDSFEQEHHKLLHSKTAAAVAEHIFGELPETVSAIYWHTTGRADMSLLEKILYIADYAEPNRSFDGVQKIRDLLFRDLDLALYTGFSMSIEELNRESKELDHHSVEAWEFLKEKRGFA